ncbi:MAG: VOC family protein [Pseudonocardiales bacterium]|nr:VOC family protein [Pseudonocardiales bacterium]
MSIQARLDVVGIVVADMAKALAFYRQVGLDIPASADVEPHVEVGLPGGLRLAFDTEEVIRSFHPYWTAVRGGRTNLAFVLPDPEGVDALYIELMAAGHESALAPFDAFWGQRYAVVHDPDGNGVDLFAPLAS